MATGTAFHRLTCTAQDVEAQIQFTYSDRSGKGTQSFLASLKHDPAVLYPDLPLLTLLQPGYFFPP